MLAHASGEWISSQWPVCPLADIASPHRMGAALTYARRYALFTLVGIAGEDDLDAPDLCIPAPAENSPRRGAEVQHSPNTSGNGGVSGRAKITPSPVLAADQSTGLRDSLINEIASLQSEGSAAEWARAALPRKNQLTAADARMVETAFALKQSAFALSLGAEPSPQDVVVSSAAETSTAAGTISSQTFTDAAADRPAAETVASAAVHAPNSAVGSTRPCLRSAHSNATGTRSTCASSPSKRACCAGADRRRRITSDLRSRGRLVANRATNSPFRCAAAIIAPRIAQGTRKPGGSRPASTRSRSRASFGRSPAWASRAFGQQPRS